MGRYITPTYYAYYFDQDGRNEIAWSGSATHERAEETRQALNRSFQPGGCNEHIRLKSGGIPHVNKVQVIRNNRSGEIVAEAKMPMFEVV
jgi:hypothetical protein